MIAFNVKPKSYSRVLFFVLLSKIIILVLLKYQVLTIKFGEGDDSNYYDAYALGHADVAVNIWPIILRKMNDLGIYSRESISYFLISLSMVAIPFLSSWLATDGKYRNNRRFFWLCVILIEIYPTLFFLSLDAYRDVFMVFSMLLGIWCIKRLLEAKLLVGYLAWISGALILGCFLYLLRPYLGAAFLVTLIFSLLRNTIIFRSVKKMPISVLLLVYIIFLLVMFDLGVLDAWSEYRDGFHGVMTGGSNLGIAFDSSVTFIPKLILSALYQVFGLWLFSPAAIFVFITESVPFSFGLFFILKNKKYADDFVYLLFLFFIAYSSIWVVSNDNLGTATRLRMLGYIPILIAFIRIYRKKHIALLNMRPVYRH